MKEILLFCVQTILRQLQDVHLNITWTMHNAFKILLFRKCIHKEQQLSGKIKGNNTAWSRAYNDVSVEADAEMASLIVRLLLQSGLESFQLEIGNVEFFKGLLEEAELDEDTVATLL